MARLLDKSGLTSMCRIKVNARRREFLNKDVQEWKSLEEVELSSTPESDHLAQVEKAKMIELANYDYLMCMNRLPMKGNSQ